MAKRIDLTGLVFGKLHVLAPAPSVDGVLYWDVRCECGTEFSLNGNSLRRGLTKSCGCIKRPRPRGDEWFCNDCQLWKKAAEFYLDSRSQKPTARCKLCQNAATVSTRDPDNHRVKNREWMQQARYGKRPEVAARKREQTKKYRGTREQRARAQLNNAVKRGDLVRPEACPKCGVERVVHGHHDDYDQPLKVEWLCAQCHADTHRLTEVE